MSEDETAAATARARTQAESGGTMYPHLVRLPLFYGRSRRVFLKHYHEAMSDGRSLIEHVQIYLLRQMARHSAPTQVPPPHRAGAVSEAVFRSTLHHKTHPNPNRMNPRAPEKPL
jgi:hypothetical protein